jgi:hypothetical protein
MSNENGATFTRRKFTNTEALENVLTSLAEQHYQGNVSLCLRAAIEDHRTTLTQNTDEIVIEQLSRQVDSIRGQQEEINAALTTIEEQLSDSAQTENVPSAVDTTAMTGIMETVYAEFEQTEQGLRMQDIVNRTGYQTSRLQPALGALIDLGYVVASTENPPRFHRAGQIHDEK